MTELASSNAAKPPQPQRAAAKPVTHADHSVAAGSTPSLKTPFLVRADKAVSSPRLPASDVPPADVDLTAGLLRRGSELLAQGDVSAARLFFERGSAQAATFVGKTCGPAFFREKGIMGASARSRTRHSLISACRRHGGCRGPLASHQAKGAGGMRLVAGRPKRTRRWRARRPRACAVRSHRQAPRPVTAPPRFAHAPAEPCHAGPPPH